MPVRISGSADGNTTSRINWKRVAPSDSAALTRSLAIERTPACADSTIGANIASASSVIFEASPMPSQMIISGR